MRISAGDSEFYRWLLHHARLMNWDLDAVDELDGVTVPRRRFFLVWASIALTNGLTPAQTGQLARGLGVTPDEVTNAYTPELRATTIDELNQALRY
ncbi:hypothetical protein OG978_47210 (plasmid) [Streptomyces sp. NBC_01591]|uniref:hypothetical protein n=1 Tax=Streptomyces sp. NBC_01591 TaxID=2975888 RepID=UPI002DD92FBA|nr:hypothetical protein [Streptomyces sp. NBC_01591]WSD66033.1 hypothetical protein OG978_00210 [Streptomyces sp. NBC_01591]WSD73085.1 hypothetical protein OG978_40615 [Streptomyces sp. NBC_01591]WSD73640.1 hypothetical protein OG978_41030 [Streptomyces sp. NBC_01591]WSD74573.1 hypothetical protein OG978_47210 [Streptomyces sp. NBC_01591]